MSVRPGDLLFLTEFLRRIQESARARAELLYIDLLIVVALRLTGDDFAVNRTLNRTLNH